MTDAKQLMCNLKPQRVFQGFTPGYSGFVLTEVQAKELRIGDRESAKCIRPYFIGRELAGSEGRPTRFIIDAHSHDSATLLSADNVYKHLTKRVLPKVRKAVFEAEKNKSDMIEARKQHLERWWTFWADRKDLRMWMKNHRRIIGASRTQRWPFVFVFISTDIAVGDKLQLFAFDDNYSFGIVQSMMHCLWYKSRSARLKVETDYNYSSRSIYDTFPWPQNVKRTQVQAIAECGERIRQIRAELLPKTKGGLRGLYRTLELPGKNPLKDAHAALDAAVLDAYEFSADKEILEQLLQLNFDVAKQIEKGEDVTPPGVPTSFGDPAPLITDDCVTAE